MVIVDTRVPQIVKDELEKQHIPFIIRELETGDIVDFEKSICIELKSAYLFIKKDKNVMNQAIRMSENFEKSYIIIIGDLYQTWQENQEKLKRSWNYVLGKIAGISARSNISILPPVQTLEEAIYITRRIFEKNERGKLQDNHKQPKYTKYEDDDILKFISQIPTLQLIHVKRLLKSFKNIKNMTNASEEELLNVYNIGEDRAKFLYSFFNKDWELKLEDLTDKLLIDDIFLQEKELLSKKKQLW
jgi:ERCC4-type nuclease